MLTYLITLTAFGSALCALTYIAIRHQLLMVALVLVAWLAASALRDTVDLALEVSELRITLADLMAIILTAVGATRILADGFRGVARGLAFALLLLVIVHALRGAVEFGLETGLNDARGWLYLAGTLLYAATVPDGWSRRAWGLLIAGGMVTAAIAVPFWLAEGLGTSSETILKDGEFVSSRPITAAGALLILQAAILALAFRWPSRSAATWVAVAAGLSTLLLQHRTVWIAAAVVAVMGFAWWSARRRQAEKAAVFAATGVLLLALPVAAWGFAQNGALVESASETTRSTSTLAWRTDGWSQLVQKDDSAPSVLLGTPSGADRSRVLNGQIVDVAPHNGSLDLYLRAGLVGLIVAGWMIVLLWLRRKPLAANIGLSSQAIALLLITQLIYSMAYSPDVLQGLIVGMLLSGLVVGGPHAERGSPARAAHREA